MQSKSTWRSPQHCVLGENPVWDQDAAVLYWIDVADPSVYCWNCASDETVRFPLPKPPASIFLAKTGRLLVVMRMLLAWLDTSTGELENIDIGRPLTGNERFNDGRCDVNGNLWISTMDRELAQDIGSLVQISNDFKIVAAPTGARLGNGICFSPDNQFLYFSDTHARTIYRYPLLSQPGAGAACLGPRTTFARLDDHPGRPDGCAVDSDGFLWSARVGGGRIDRYDPNGQLIDTLELPVSHPTHCTFGGPGLRTLFVTSLRFPKDSPVFAGQELAGAVLAYNVGAQGLAEYRFGLGQ